MARRFVKLKSVRKSYAEQGEIFFRCQNYRRQPEETRAHIRAVCREAGGEYERALFDLMTTQRGWIEICMRHHISEATLTRCRKRFFERY